ncbi:UNVERIFIED_CONTAM: hypothetical protein Sradi_3285500 [Sesamum radiatum]|uniref:Uncharacterized protein n=1 Tax=Sesamum radiatum TaxID=300843 RepID=A0AAW2R2B0_SESRA
MARTFWGTVEGISNLRTVGGVGTGTVSPDSSSGASMLEGVAIHAGAKLATCSLIATDTIC